MAQGDRLVLRRSADSIRFVHPPGYSYFAVLREKLNWSESAARGTDPD
jgi:NAD+ kinase